MMKKIEYYKSVLASVELQRQIVKDELLEVKEKYGDERRTEITFEEGDINIEDIIADETVVVTISHSGYIKRTPVSEYRLQNRGGRGSRGSKTKQEDFVEHMFIASNHNYLLLFTEQGRCHWLRVYEIPEGTRNSGGRFIQNVVSIPPEDKVKAYIIVQDLKDEDFLNSNYIMFCTKNGMVKKTALEAFSRPRSNGINAITINEGDQLLEARLTNGNNEIFLGSRRGYAVRFHEKDVRPMGRTAAGVRGMTLQGPDDAVVGMACVEVGNEELTILAISENGTGKRSLVEDYRLTKRGGKGVKTLEITDKTGALLAIKAVREDDNLMITTKAGIVIRIAVSDIRVMGRATQGVRVIRVDDKDEIADVTVLPYDEDEENDVEEGEGAEIGEDAQNENEESTGDDAEA